MGTKSRNEWKKGYEKNKSNVNFGIFQIFIAPKDKYESHFILASSKTSVMMSLYLYQKTKDLMKTKTFHIFHMFVEYNKVLLKTIVR